MLRRTLIALSAVAFAVGAILLQRSFGLLGRVSLPHEP